jgi:hypothetical protein
MEIFRQLLVASRDVSTATVIKFRGYLRSSDKGRSVVSSMAVHRVHDNSDDDCDGYTDVEDGISEWNLRW